MKVTIYTVEFAKFGGAYEYSRSFTRIGQARKWAKWLRGQAFNASVRIMQGGPGGMEVK